MDLGARPWQVFWLVTLPMIAQALLSAWLLTFTLSLDDVVLSAFLSGPGATTMPLVIFSRARLGLNPSVNAVATIIIAAGRDRRRRGQLRAGAQRAPARRRRRGRAAGADAMSSLARLPLPRRWRWPIVGAYVGFSKALVAVFPVFLLAWLRFAIAAVAMAPLAAPARRRGAARSTHPPPAVPRVVLRQLPVLDLHAVRRLPQLGARRRRDHGGDPGRGRAAVVAAARRAPGWRGARRASPAPSPASPWSRSRATPRASSPAARSLGSALLLGARDLRGALRRDRQEALGARRPEADQRPDQPLGPGCW